MKVEKIKTKKHKNFKIGKISSKSLKNQHKKLDLKDFNKIQIDKER